MKYVTQHPSKPLKVDLFASIFAPTGTVAGSKTRTWSRAGTKLNFVPTTLRVSLFWMEGISRVNATWAIPYNVAMEQSQLKGATTRSWMVLCKMRMTHCKTRRVRVNLSSTTNIGVNTIGTWNKWHHLQQHHWWRFESTGNQHDVNTSRSWCENAPGDDANATSGNSVRYNNLIELITPLAETMRSILHLTSQNYCPWYSLLQVLHMTLNITIFSYKQSNQWWFWKS